MNNLKGTLPALKVGGVTHFTTIDFPGHLAAVIFTQGCPWRCRYCQNKALLDPEKETGISLEGILEFLRKRRDFLEGVVFSGGEPTLWRSVPDFISKISEIGYLIALHTNGAYPDRLASLLGEGLVDWVALDVKAPFSDYQRITTVPGSGEPVRESLDMLLHSSCAHEIRTTYHPEILSTEDLIRIATTIKDAGGTDIVIQKCLSDNILDETLELEDFDFKKSLSGILPELEKIPVRVKLR